MNYFIITLWNQWKELCWWLLTLLRSLVSVESGGVTL